MGFLSVCRRLAFVVLAIALAITTRVDYTVIPKATTIGGGSAAATTTDHP